MNIDTGATVPAWHLLRKTGAPIEIAVDWSNTDGADSPGRIRCPRCDWQPEASSRWVCWSGNSPEPPFASCGTSWNTFLTHGQCPGCSHQWTWTSCLRCGEWSRHKDWYEIGLCKT